MDDLVSVVILNFNGKTCIERCIDSVLAQDYAHLEVIVVDNGSVDGSPELIKRKYKEVLLVENGRNLGFAAANNIGIRYTRGIYTVVMNNDTELESTCIGMMKKAIEKDARYGACASKIYLESDHDLLDAAGIVIFRDGLSIGRGRLERGDFYDREEEVFFASGCCFMARRSMLKDVKLGNEYFDEDFFMYADDTDLGWRARLRGWKTIYTPQARLYHAHSAASGSYSPLKAFHVERNRIWIAVKYFPLYLLIYSQLFTLQRYLFQAYGALTGEGASGAFAKEHSRAKLIRVLGEVYVSAIRGLPKMLTKRKEIQKRRLISSHDIKALMTLYGISAKRIGLKR
ncbi:MAG: glycosyltransferase family 2 protein [Syntrophales bacterium LBB04]|nr:glycosyltransferase family 2 protein [Syntrophales bacterium LBB04]